MRSWLHMELNAQQVYRSPIRAQGFSNPFQEVFVILFTCFHILSCCSWHARLSKTTTATSAATGVATWCHLPGNNVSRVDIMVCASVMWCAPSAQHGSTDSRVRIVACSLAQMVQHGPTSARAVRYIKWLVLVRK